MSAPATGGFRAPSGYARHSAVEAAARLLERVFAPVEVPLAFRLWDGTSVHAGAPGPAGFTVVFHSPQAFRRCLRRPDSLTFGEAFIGGDIDIEGDVFAAMAAAAPLEGLRLSPRTRLAALATLLRL